MPNARARRLEARREERRHVFTPTAVPAGVKAAKRGSAVTGDLSARGTFLLPLRIKPSGQWGYGFGALRLPRH